MLLPAQIAEIAKALPGDEVTLAVDENSVTITAGTAGESNIKLLTLRSTDFPVFGQRDSESDEETAFAISVGEFKKVLRQVIFAVSTDENKLKFTHVNMELAGNTLQLAASDTYRLADTNCPVERLSGSTDIKMLVPARPLHEFLRIAQKLTDDLVIKVICKGNNISIKTEAIKIATRLGSEEYPDIRKIFPTTFEGPSR
ncbi:MAG: DNA polymerase III subunit beta [Firmicutes bacterium]|nr:DNA polymerase III subunit beta [Bacillota bacterium]